LISSKQFQVSMQIASLIVDPTWDEVTCAARGCAPAAIIAPNFIGRHRRIQRLVKRNFRSEAVNARVRRMRDEDIANADEREIATAEKVLLLVSSCLNDKSSLPGHVYRHLIREHQKREMERRRLRWEEDDVSDSEVDGACRTTREDTHAVIRHITATLLEVRPVFGASTHIAEMFATAVEALVFGEVYDLVFGEVIEQTRKLDETLMIQISEFQIKIGRGLLLSSSECYDTVSSSSSSGSSSGSSSSSGPTTIKGAAVPNCDIEELVSDDALRSLRMLPESHSVAEKVYHCVQFLECIVSWSQFRTITNENHPRSKRRGITQWKEKRNASIGADSLLKMVCQHIIVAKVPNLNAEIVFLEEFARDGQLLKGREGYALVTMLASLRFMNASTDFGKDIFHDEDD